VDAHRPLVQRAIMSPRFTTNSPLGVARSRRLSIGMFVHPNYDQSIACVPTCVPPGEQARFPAITAGEHIRRKIEASHAAAAA